MTHRAEFYAAVPPNSPKRTEIIGLGDVLDITVTFNDVEFLVTIAVDKIYKDTVKGTRKERGPAVELGYRVVAKTNGLVIL